MVVLDQPGDRVMTGIIVQYCPVCNTLVDAALTYQYNGNGMRISDLSVCPCGQVLWDWHMARHPVGELPQSKKVKEQLRLF